MGDNTVKVAVYARVSSQEQADEGTSIEHREEQLSSFCLSQNWEILHKRLSQIAEPKSRLADDWVKLNMDSTTYKDTQQSLNQEESRLKSIRNEVDPAQLEQLEDIKYLLRFWEEQSRYFDFNLVDDDLRMIRIGDVPHDTVMEFAGIDRKEVSKLMQFPTTKRELIDRLQVRAVVFGDRTEVNALFPIRPISSHKCTSPAKGKGIKGMGLLNKNLRGKVDDQL